MCETTTSRKELAFTPGVGPGSKGLAVKRLQEWLNLRGNGITIDGEFGPATQAALKNFQASQDIKPGNALTAQAWSALVQPMRNSLSATIAQQSNGSDACLQVAKIHLAQHPLEVGGDNCGPWVRLYTGGNEGADWRWCAGFVSFVMKQACDLAGISAPLKGSLSCDTLAARGQVAKRFVSGKDLVTDQISTDALGSCAIFLVRRTPGDWTHAGFAFNFTSTTFQTIEGNTNDGGSTNGYEVCSRTRRLDGNKDFITLD